MHTTRYLTDHGQALITPNPKSSCLTRGIALRPEPCVRSPAWHRRLACAGATLAAAVLLPLAVTGCAGSVSKAANPVVSIVAAAAMESATAGNPLEFLVGAEPAPRADLTVRVTIASVGCELAQSPHSVTIAAGDSDAVLTVQTTGVAVGADGCTVTVSIAPGESYRVADAGGAASTHLTAGSEVERVVTIKANNESIVEGDDVTFTLNATPPPDPTLTVYVSWSQSGSFLTQDQPQEVIIPRSGTATLSARTADDSTEEPNGSVTITIEAGSGYTFGEGESASVSVSDNDAAAGGDPSVTIAGPGSPVAEGERGSFTVTASPAPASALTVNVTWSDPGAFLTGTQPTTVTIPASQTAASLSFRIKDDLTDEPNSRVTVTVQSGGGYTAGTPREASATVTDDDPRGFTSTGGTDVTWGAPGGPDTDGAVTRVFLNGGTETARFELRVDRGSSSSCSMVMDPSNMPGSATLGPAQV